MRRNQQADRSSQHETQAHQTPNVPSRKDRPATGEDDRRDIATILSKCAPEPDFGEYNVVINIHLAEADI